MPTQPSIHTTSSNPQQLVARGSHRHAFELEWHLTSQCFVAGVPVQQAGIYIQKYHEKLQSFLSTSDPVYCYLEVAETNSVVVEKPKRQAHKCK